jgi:hypothetical protein
MAEGKQVRPNLTSLFTRMFPFHPRQCWPSDVLLVSEADAACQKIRARSP